MADQSRLSLAGAAALLALGAGAASPALAEHDRVYVRSDAGYEAPQYDEARVIDAEPIVKYVKVRTPVRECYEDTEYYSPDEGYYDDGGHGRHDDGRLLSREATGTIAGGIIGGVIGRQFGGGKGRDAMTLAGTLIGAAVGRDRVERRHARGYGHARHDRHHGYRGERVVEARPVRYCETRYEYRDEERIDGYRVTYDYNGRTYITRTDYAPGDTIRVRVDVSPVTR